MGKESYIHPEADEQSDGSQPIAAVPTVEFNWFFSLKDPFFQKEYDAYRMDEASLGSKILFRKLIVRISNFDQNRLSDDVYLYRHSTVTQAEV